MTFNVWGPYPSSFWRWPLWGLTKTNPIPEGRVRWWWIPPVVFLGIRAPRDEKMDMASSKLIKIFSFFFNNYLMIFLLAYKPFVSMMLLTIVNNLLIHQDIWGSIKKIRLRNKKIILFRTINVDTAIIVVLVHITDVVKIQVTTNDPQFGVIE